ncbi:MAG: PAS domain S-box protein, partial [Moraxellaceae bacterium]
MNTSDPTTRGHTTVRRDVISDVDYFYKDAERFQLAMLATRDAVRDWNLITNVQSWSNAAFTLFGYAPNNIEPGIEFWRARVHPSDHAAIDSLQTALHDSSIHHWTCEYSFRREDGIYVCVLDRSYIVRDSEGIAVRLVSVLFDITARKLAREQVKIALTESEGRFRLLTEAIPQQVWTADPDGSLNYVNKRVTDYFGMNLEDVLGTGWT